MEQYESGNGPDAVSYTHLDVYKRQTLPRTPTLVNGKPTAKSPLSPAIHGGEWTCEIKPNAITSAFRQVDSIKELVSNDIIERCTNLAIEESDRRNVNGEVNGIEGSSNGGIKRSSEDDDLENLFVEKKARTAEEDYKYVYEPVSFDEWKQFVVSSIQ